MIILIYPLIGTPVQTTDSVTMKLDFYRISYVKKYFDQYRAFPVEDELNYWAFLYCFSVLEFYI